MRIKQLTVLVPSDLYDHLNEFTQNQGITINDFTLMLLNLAKDDIVFTKESSQTPN